MIIHLCEFRFSLIVGNFWLKVNSPDTGVWRFKTKRWVFVDKTGTSRNQKRTEWFRIV